MPSPAGLAPRPRSPQHASPGGEGWAAETASWAAVRVVAAAAGLTAVSPSAGAGLARRPEMAVAAELAALVVQAEETGAAAADGACDEASVAFLGSRGLGSGGRCLNDSQQLRSLWIYAVNQILLRKTQL